VNFSLPFAGRNLDGALRRWARRHAEGSAVELVHGDAENLPFPQVSFDAVINVESAHCYGSIERFLAEVHRVLRPGG
jgi:fatty-acid O-methyltransferase